MSSPLSSEHLQSVQMQKGIGSLRAAEAAISKVGLVQTYLANLPIYHHPGTAVDNRTKGSNHVREILSVDGKAIKIHHLDGITTVFVQQQSLHT